MRGWELAQFLLEDGQTRRSFQGVCPIDVLPRRVAYPCSLVINTAASNSKGEHWTALYIDPFQKGVFFDSFGLPPRQQGLTNFLNTHCVYWRHSDLQIQSVLSDKCGKLCLYFLHQQARGVNLKRLLTPFDRLLLYKNDLWISDWYYRQLQILARQSSPGAS